MNINKSFFTEYSFFINAKHFWCLEIAINWSISQNFLHHFFFRCVSPSSSNKIRSLNFSDWFTTAIVTAMISLCFLFIWCTFFWNHISIFCQKYIKMRPSSIASFIHIVTCHKLLRRKHWWLFSIFQFQSSFHNLSEWNCVAWATSSLISKVASKIISINISKIKWLWYFTIRDFIWSLIRFHVFLCFC